MQILTNVIGAISSSNFAWTPIQFRDALDIVVVAACIYAVLLLLKKTRSLFLLNGIGIVTVVYILAQAFNLYLTTQLFNLFFSFFIIIVIVVFQRELRRFFETLSLWRRFSQHKRETVPDAVRNQIIQVVTKFAQSKTGALIVLTGMQPIDRYLESGVILNGKISVPLLLSIFDPSSPGHDGAVVIEGDRIRAFGVHLPLADNIQQIKNVGTRHRAALGLAERTDALIVVVSEERGTISVAQSGLLHEIASPEALQPVLHEFLRSSTVDEIAIRPWSIISHNTKEKFAALGITVFLWYAMVVQLGGGVRTIDFAVPIEFRDLPKEYIVEQLIPPEIGVSLSGRNQDFTLLKSENLVIAVEIDLVREGWYKVNIGNQNLSNLPSSLSVVKFSPRTIQFRIGRTEN